MGDDRAAVYIDNGLVVYRASAFGGCTKMLAALRMGYEPLPVPARMREVFDAGHRAEDDAIRRLKEDGWSVTDQQVEYDLILTKTIRVRSHIDGRVHRGGEPTRLLEVKSQSQAEWDAYEPGWKQGLWKKYAWQLSVMMRATTWPAMVVRINRDDETIPLDLIYVDEPLISMREIRGRMMIVERMAMTGTLPETCEMSFPCPVYHLHVEEEVEELEDPAVDLLAKEYDKARAEVKKWEGIREGARRALRLGIVGDNIRTTSGIGVRFSRAVTRRLNEKKMRGELGDEVVERYVEEAEVERMTVRMPRAVGQSDD